MVVEDARLPPDTAGGRRAAREPGASGRSRRRRPQPGRGRPRRPVSHTSGLRARGGDRWQVAQRGQGVAPGGWALTTMETDDQFVVMNLTGLHMHAFWYCTASVHVRAWHCGATVQRDAVGGCMATYLPYFILLMLDRVQTHHSPPIARFRAGLRAHPPTRWSVRIAARRHLRRRGARNPRFLRARGVSDRHREKNGRRRRPRAHAPRKVPALDRPNQSSLTPIIVLHHHHSWLPDPAPAPDPCSSRFAVLAVRAPVRSGGSIPD